MLVVVFYFCILLRILPFFKQVVICPDESFVSKKNTLRKGRSVMCEALVEAVRVTM